VDIKIKGRRPKRAKMKFMRLIVGYNLLED
jgi:hypothetical protein